MKTTLSADKGDFQISSLSSEEQVVAGQPYAEWDWIVKPLSYGQHDLYLKASARVVLSGYGEKSVDVPVISKRIQVSISPVYIVKENYLNIPTWQFLVGGGSIVGVISTVVGWLFRRKKGRAGFAVSKKK